MPSARLRNFCVPKLFTFLPPLSLALFPPRCPTRSAQVDAIIRSGLSRFSDEVGRLWCRLADFYIRSGAFERARDVFEEAAASVTTVPRCAGALLPPFRRIFTFFLSAHPRRITRFFLSSCFAMYYSSVLWMCLSLFPNPPLL
jgi:hypothetical protein